MSADLLVVGDCCFDVVVTGSDVVPVFGDVEMMVDAATLTVGGSSAIVACGAARLGVSTAMVTRVGADPSGGYLRDAVSGFGVDVSPFITDPDAATGMTIILVRASDRGMLTAAGTIDRLSADDVPAELLAGCRHVHVGAYYLQSALRPGLPDLFAAARRAGATTSVDPNWDPAGRWDGIVDLLGVTDILFVNAAEAAAIADRLPGGGGGTLVQTMERLAAGATTVVVKQGRDGATGMRGDEVVRVPALDVDVADSVGAGDTFAAGFLSAHLAGESLTEALARAGACGSLSTRAVGGTGSQPDLAEAEMAAATLRSRATVFGS
jgi:sugar/nucleoside kinase (ribokinase family)